MEQETLPHYCSAIFEEMNSRSSFDVFGFSSCQSPDCKLFPVNQILTAERYDLDADTSKPEAEIDRLVYGLSEKEIEIVEGS